MSLSQITEQTKYPEILRDPRNPQQQQVNQQNAYKINTYIYVVLPRGMSSILCSCSVSFC